MFVFKKYDRQNQVWRFVTKYLRFLCTSWSGETPTGNFSDAFFILDKNNERPDWMTDLKHTDSAWFSKVTQVNSL